MLRALEDVARRVGLEVRVEEPWRGGPSAGGMCLLRGRRVVLLDALAPLPERVEVLCEALSELDLDTVFLPPALRARILRRSAARSGAR